MSTSDWFEAALRVLVVIGMLSGAVRSYRQMKRQGTWHTLTVVVVSIAMLIYITLGVLLVAGWGIMMAPDNAILFAVVAIAYFWGGLYAIGKLSAAMDRRSRRSGEPDQRYPLP